MEITLLSSNMFLLPKPFSVDNTKRITLFIKMCLDNKVDFIFLQEVWLNNYVNLLKKKLSDYYFIGKPDFLYNKTGLIIFSKYKPLNFKKCSFEPNNGSAFYDSLGRKGYLYAQFEINKKRIDVLNIHLNCPYKGAQNNARETQLYIINRFVNDADNSLIVAGDFNGPCEHILKNTSPINNLNSGVKSFSSDNRYTTRGFHKFARKFIRSYLDRTDLDTDHVLFFPKKLKGKITKRFIMDPLVSDHYPIFAKITC